MKYNFIKEKDNKAIFTGNYMECYIPNSLFEKGISYIDNGIVTTIGTFNLRVANSADADITKSKLLTFGVSTVITMKPTDIEKKTIRLLPNKPEITYQVLKFYNGDELLTSLDVVEAVDNVETFMMKLLVEGKLPTTIPYTDGFNLFMKNLEINHIDLNVPAATLSIIYSEVYRYAKDPSLALRKVLGKGKCGELDYITANMRSICANSSTFSALTFEDQDAMIIKSINRNRFGYNNEESPVEQIIKEQLAYNDYEDDYIENFVDDEYDD